MGDIGPPGSRCDRSALQRRLKSNDARVQLGRNADLLIEASLELADSKSRLTRKFTDAD
jgi:hypothetical protein